MTNTDALSKRRAGTVLNFTSKQQEADAAQALAQVVKQLQKTFSVKLDHEKVWRLADIVERLRLEHPDVLFADLPRKWNMRPDGGILSILDSDGARFPILIVEVKNQGTNDRRAKKKMPKQAQGNAVERLAKNVIGFRTALLSEGIMPFVCFGYGCDFAEKSSILGRANTVAMFGPLNEINVFPAGDAGQFCRGSFYFREKRWSKKEMAEVMFEVAQRSVHFYFAKYGQARFEATVG